MIRLTRPGLLVREFPSGLRVNADFDVPACVINWCSTDGKFDLEVSASLVPESIIT